MLMKGDYDEILLKWELVGKTSEIVMTSLSLSLMCWKVSCPFSPSYWERDVCVCVCVCFDDDDDTHEWWHPSEGRLGVERSPSKPSGQPTTTCPMVIMVHFSLTRSWTRHLSLSLSFSFFDTFHKTPFNDHPFEFINPNEKFCFDFFTRCFFNFPSFFPLIFFGVLHIHVVVIIIIIGCGRKLTSQMRPLKISHKSSLSLSLSQKWPLTLTNCCLCFVSEDCLMGDGTVQNLDLLSLFMQNLKP